MARPTAVTMHSKQMSQQTLFCLVTLMSELTDYWSKRNHGKQIRNWSRKLWRKHSKKNSPAHATSKRATQHAQQSSTCIRKNSWTPKIDCNRRTSSVQGHRSFRWDDSHSFCPQRLMIPLPKAEAISGPRPWQWAQGQNKPLDLPCMQPISLSNHTHQTMMILMTWWVLC